MTDRSVIIIGAGLAGLSTGVFAQLNGYRSRIFEHHGQPGGVAAAWERGEYLIDGGIHFVMGHKPGTDLYTLYEQLGILPANRFIDMTAYGRFVDERSGTTIEVTGDLDQLAADLKAMSPGDARLVDDLIKSARAMQGLDMSAIGLEKPPELMGKIDTLGEMWSARGLVRHMTGRNNRPIREVVRDAADPRLQAFFEYLFLPDVPVWFASMVLALVADGQMAFIEGGCRDFVGGIEGRYGSLGGEITYDATVETILVEDDRAVGVRLADGTEHRADAVVSAADGHSTIFGMLEGRYIDETIRERYEHWALFRPYIMVTFGVARTIPDDPAFTTVRLAQPLVVGPDVIDGLFIRLFNYSPRFAPPGKTVIQVEFETDWDYWNGLYQDHRTRYETEKEQIAGVVLDRLDAHYPGIADQVEVTDVVTPLTIYNYTRNHRGAWEGWLMTPNQVSARLERTLPGLDRFYMAGQWVMPGGGVPPVLYSGRHAVQLMCRDDGRAFTAAAE